MGKRAAANEEPYRPLLDPGLMSSALAQVAPGAAAPREAPPTPPVSSKIVDLPRPETPPKPQPRREELADAAPKQSPQPVVEKFDQEKRILFTRGETQSVDRLVTSLATRLNAQVKVSHVMRALVALLLNAEGQIDKRAGEAGAIVRPPNGDAQALQRFERDIAGIIGAALRDAGPIR